MKGTIKERVKQTIQEQLGVSKKEIKNESHITRNLGADSIDRIEIIMALEEEFDIEIPDELAEDLNTVQDHINFMIEQGV